MPHIIFVRAYTDRILSDGALKGALKAADHILSVYDP